MREVDVPPLANIDNAPEGTLGVLGYATFGQEIDAIVRFAKQAIALHTPTENELADGAKDNRPHVALLFRSKTQMPAYEDALEQAGLTTLVVGQAALLNVPKSKTSSPCCTSYATTPTAPRSCGCSPHHDSACPPTICRRSPASPNGATPRNATARSCRPASCRRMRILPDADIRATVRAYRDQVPNAVFLIDVLLRGHVRHLIDGVLSRTGAASVIHAGRVIQQVQRTAGHPLPKAGRTAITALGLDITCCSPNKMRHPDAAIAPHRMPLRHSTRCCLWWTPTCRRSPRRARQPARVHLVGGFAA